MSENERIYIDTKEEINKKRGKRLSECRNYRNMTQAQLAEICNTTDNYISMLECGTRHIDWNKAVLFSKALNVSASYIMCESDNAKSDRKLSVIDKDSYGNTDLFYICFLCSLGYDIRFLVVYLYDENKPEAIVEVNDFEDFSLSDYKCIVSKGHKEACITHVFINGQKTDYSTFCFTINRLYDYTGYTFDNLKQFCSDYSYQQGSKDACNEEIATAKLGNAFLSDQEKGFYNQMKEWEFSDEDIDKALSGVRKSEYQANTLED